MLRVFLHRNRNKTMSLDNPETSPRTFVNLSIGELIYKVFLSANCRRLLNYFGLFLKEIKIESCPWKIQWLLCGYSLFYPLEYKFIRVVFLQVVKDFFGRVVKKQAPLSVKEGGIDGIVKSPIWYRFKEGYNNAVRKDITLSDFI